MKKKLSKRHLRGARKFKKELRRRAIRQSLKELKKKKRQKQLRESEFPEQREFKERFKNWGKGRKNYLRRYYEVIPEFDDEARVVVIDKNFGFELEEDRDYFFIKAQEILKGFPVSLEVDLRGCDRIWPSGIMFLNSYYHWFLIKNGNKEASSQAFVRMKNNSALADYVTFCGFRQYVTVENTDKTVRQTINFDPHKVIKLEKETGKESYWKRQVEVREFVRKFANLTPDQNEIFNDRVLTELFGNLSEHGVNYRALGFDSTMLGWYVLAQYHHRSGFLNISFADNGIGIANSLRTGPQGNYLKKEFRDTGSDNRIESKYLEKAMEKDVSGAFDAESYKTYWKIKKKQKGKSRGMGFSRIEQSCKLLNIDFTVVSNNAYLNKPAATSRTVLGFEEKVFAGTIFNLRIPIRGESSESN